MYLPLPADVDSALLERAGNHLAALEHHLAKEADLQVPTTMVEDIISTFQSINSGVKIPFKEAPAGLLSLTSAQAQSSISQVVEKVHPFDNKAIHCGSDATLLQWILAGASQLCPSCHESMHNHQVKRKAHTTLSVLFLTYNSCLQTKHALYCCFVCNQLISNMDLTHAICCFQQHYNTCCKLGLNFEHICVLWSTSLEQWKKAHFLICPVASCVDADEQGRNCGRP